LRARRQRPPLCNLRRAAAGSPAASRRRGESILALAKPGRRRVAEPAPAALGCHWRSRPAAAGFACGGVGNAHGASAGRAQRADREACRVAVGLGTVGVQAHLRAGSSACRVFCQRQEHSWDQDPSGQSLRRVAPAISTPPLRPRLFRQLRAKPVPPHRPFRQEQRLLHQRARSSGPPRGRPSGAFPHEALAPAPPTTAAMRPTSAGGPRVSGFTPTTAPSGGTTRSASRSPTA